MPQFFPEANPLDLLPNATFTGGIPAQRADRAVSDRTAVSFLRLQHAMELLGQPHPKSKTRTTSRPASSSSMRRGPCSNGRRFNGTLSFNTDSRPSAQHERRVRQRAARRGDILSAGGQAPVGHGQFVNTEFYARTTGASAELTVDAGVRFHYFTPTRKPGRPGRAVRAGRASIRAAAPLLYQPIATRRFASRDQSADRRRSFRRCTSAGRFPAQAISTTARSCMTGHRSSARPLSSPLVSASPGMSRETAGPRFAAVPASSTIGTSTTIILELTELPPLVSTYTSPTTRRLGSSSSR